MYTRTLESEIKKLSKQFRVITILGPRQAGKTTLCKICFPSYRYVSLEDPDVRAFAQEDPRAFFSTYQDEVIIDEIQRVPELLSYIQTIVDTDQKKAKFILTGSDQLGLSESISQSLAGRTAMFTLLPLSLEELPIGSRTELECIIEGFMPEKHYAKIETSHYFRSYFQTYVERDVRRLVKIKDFNLFEKFVRLCAGRIGQVLNLSSLGNDIGVSSNTMSSWISILEASFIVFRINPFYQNFNKRIIKSSKLYFVDTGLACWLLGIDNEKQLERDPLRGALFENLVIAECMKAQLNRGIEPRLYFFRDSQGNEVDLIIHRGRSLVPVEIKSAKTWHSSFLKGIAYFQKLAGTESTKGQIVYTGDLSRSSENYDLIPFADCAGFGH